MSEPDPIAAPPFPAGGVIWADDWNDDCPKEIQAVIAKLTIDEYLSDEILKDISVDFPPVIVSPMKRWR